MARVKKNKYQKSEDKLLIPDQLRIKKIILPIIQDDCILVFGQEKTHLPFEIKRFYFITDSIPGLPRGYHAHKELKQILFCIKGSIKLIIDNRHHRKEIILDKPNEGIILDRMVWYELHDFKKESILLVLANDLHKESDYIRSYSEYRQYTKQEGIVPVVKNDKNNQ